MLLPKNNIYSTFPVPASESREVQRGNMPFIRWMRTPAGVMAVSSAWPPAAAQIEGGGGDIRGEKGREGGEDE